VVVQADSPYKTWKDIAEAGRKTKLRYGHSGPRTLQAIVLNLMAQQEGFSFINIPYKGSPESQTALIGGHLDLAAGDFTYSLVEAGKNFRGVGFAALGDVARGTWLAAVEVMLDVGLGQRHAGRTAVNHAADGGAVRFTEHGDTEQFAECAARHGNEREKGPRECAEV
jgi:hypothetical protein